MPDKSDRDTASRPMDADERARNAEARVRELEAELARIQSWRQSTLIAVVLIALLAILMLGIVAFNAVDDQALAPLTHL